MELMPNFSRQPQGPEVTMCLPWHWCPQATEHHLWKTKWKPVGEWAGEQGGSCGYLSSANEDGAQGQPPPWALTSMSTHFPGNGAQISTNFLPCSCVIFFAPTLTEDLKEHLTSYVSVLGLYLACLGLPYLQMWNLWTWRWRAPACHSHLFQSTWAFSLQTGFLHLGPLRQWLWGSAAVESSLPAKAYWSLWQTGDWEAGGHFCGVCIYLALTVNV